ARIKLSVVNPSTRSLSNLLCLLLTYIFKELLDLTRPFLKSGCKGTPNFLSCNIHLSFLHFVRTLTPLPNLSKIYPVLKKRAAKVNTHISSVQVL
ncbi:MAG: hypothetical protein ACK4EX_04975, partial [Thermaurantimonas sp.]|uniref:hypothetical protein n=1 Tax=Thermaurantimonas sp. TaxID=2681568 RepID=UPI00391DFF52